MRVLKFFLPLLVLALLCLCNVFTYAGKWGDPTDATILAKDVAVCAFLVLLYRFVFVRVFSIQEYTARLPGVRTALGWLCVLPLYILVEHFLSYFLVYWDIPAEMLPMESTLDVSHMDILQALLAAPVLEESCFRIMMITPFHSKKGKVYAVIVSSLLFGWIHGIEIERRLSCVMAGLFLAAILLVSKNLVMPILVHSATNSLFTVCGLIGIRFANLLFIWPGGHLLGATWPVWVACILLCAVGVWLLLSQRRRERRPDAQFADGQGGLT